MSDLRTLAVIAGLSATTAQATPQAVTPGAVRRDVAGRGIQAGMP